MSTIEPEPIDDIQFGAPRRPATAGSTLGRTSASSMLEKLLAELADDDLRAKPMEAYARAQLKKFGPVYGDHKSDSITLPAGTPLCHCSLWLQSRLRRRFPAVWDQLTHRIARNKTDVPRIGEQADTLVLFLTSLSICLVVSALLGLRVLYAAPGAFVPAVLIAGFFTLIAVGLVGPAGMKTSAERTVQLHTELGRTVVMRPHKVEAVTVHHVAARRALAWVLWLAVVPPWAVLFA